MVAVVNVCSEPLALNCTQGMSLDGADIRLRRSLRARAAAANAHVSSSSLSGSLQIYNCWNLVFYARRASAFICMSRSSLGRRGLSFMLVDGSLWQLLAKAPRGMVKPCMRGGVQPWAPENEGVEEDCAYEPQDFPAVS
jgi:hypothetical protein